jgi:hypothetical protein
VKLPLNPDGQHLFMPTRGHLLCRKVPADFEEAFLMSMYGAFQVHHELSKNYFHSYKTCPSHLLQDTERCDDLVRPLENNDITKM